MQHDRLCREPSLRIDYRERRSPLYRLVLDSALFDLRIEALGAGDYIIDDRIVLERKTLRDFALSVIDGRLFAQAASISRMPFRPAMLIEGPKPDRMPRVHPNALKGALLSLAVAWRIPVVFSRNPEDSLNCLEILVEQSQALSPNVHCPALRSSSIGRRQPQLAVLQSLPGVGPKLAKSLLTRFGSLDGVMRAGEGELASVSGCGPKTAKTIRELLEAQYPRG